MNVVKQVLEKCKFGDDIKPEFDQHQLAAEIASMPPTLFNMFSVELKNAAVIKDVMVDNSLQVTIVGKP